MSDASVRAIDGRAVVRVGGSELLDAYIGQAVNAAGGAAASEDAAKLAAATALASSRYFPNRAAGEAASDPDDLFSTDDGAGNVIYYRRTSAGSVEIGRAVTPGFLASPDGADLVGTSQEGSWAFPRTVAAELRDWVKPQQFGAIGDGVANDTQAFIRALDHCRANGKNLVIPDATYVLNADGEDTFANFAGQDLCIRGEGRPKLKFAGAGRAMIVDRDGTLGSHYGGMLIENLIIEGSAAITDGFYFAGISRSIVQNVEVREVTGKAFNIKFAITCRFALLKFSINDVAQTFTPAVGIYLDNNGAGYYTSNCTLDTCIIEGNTGIGVHIVDGNNNCIIGGTFEGIIGKGLVINNGCRRNSVRSVWFEANSVGDVELNGVANALDHCNCLGGGSQSAVKIIDAQGTVIVGGFATEINISSGAKMSTFVGVGLSDNPSVGFTGVVNSIRRIGCTKLDVNANVTGQFQDVLGPTSAFTPDVSQGGAVTASVNQGVYSLAGDQASLAINLTVTGTGATGQPIQVGGIPAVIALPNHGPNTIVGHAYLLDSGAAIYVGVAVRVSASAFAIQINGQGDVAGVLPNFGLASGDVITAQLNYVVA